MPDLVYPFVWSLSIPLILIITYTSEIGVSIGVQITAGIIVFIGFSTWVHSMCKLATKPKEGMEF